MEMLLIFLAIVIGLAFGLFFAYSLIQRSEAVTEDLLDRIQFGRAGEYLLIQYERQKLKAERKEWWKPKKQPIEKTEQTAKIEPPKEKTEDEKQKEKIFQEIIKEKSESVIHAKKLQEQATLAVEEGREFFN